MSADNREDNEKNFEFIQEEIVPKKKNKFKKYTVLLLGTIILAAVFGVVARAFFVMSEPLFKESTSEPLEEPILFPTETPAPSKTPQPTPTKEPVAVQEPAEFTIKDYEKLYGTLSEITLSVNPSIVTVSCLAQGVDWFQNTYEQKNVTSGIIVAKNSSKVYILVSNSRIKDANNINVTFYNASTYEAVLQTRDSDVDLAVVTVNCKNINKDELEKIIPVELGESNLVSAGDPIIALGNPNGYMYSMEVGIITNGKSSASITDNRMDLFNTNIPYNKNGDGIIVDLKGKVKGIITHHFDEDLNNNINTVMSISRLKPIIEKLVNNMDRIYFGIIGADVTDEAAAELNVPLGVYITEVEAKSPAFDAGLQNGDVIVKIDENPITSLVSMSSLFSKYKVRDKINVTVYRTTNTVGRELSFEVELGKKYK